MHPMVITNGTTASHRRSNYRYFGNISRGMRIERLAEHIDIDVTTRGDLTIVNLGSRSHHLRHRRSHEQPHLSSTNPDLGWKSLRQRELPC